MQVYHEFFWYPDPDQRFLKRIRIRANDTDPTGSGSGSETLDYIQLTYFSVTSLIFITNGGIQVFCCGSYNVITSFMQGYNKNCKHLTLVTSPLGPE